jgi:hypothetical protein
MIAPFASVAFKSLINRSPLLLSVTATSDIPKQVKISVNPTLPHVPSAKWFSVREEEVENICSSNSTTLTPPSGNDAGYKCPGAGLYNFKVSSNIWGNPEAWYSSTYGYNMGASVKFYDSVNEEEFSTCYFDIMVQKGPNDYSFMNGGFLFPAAIGLTGITAGFMLRKRRTGMVDLEPSEEGATTNFELIIDPSTRV